MERVEKLTAAERQIKEAIFMFFERRDCIAIHTLAGAAHEVCYALAKAKGITGLLKDHPDVRPEMHKEWNALLNEAKNFFKHADSDPDETLEFDPRANEMLILDAIVLFARVTGRLCHEFAVFTAWFTVRYPGLLKGDTKDERLEALSRRLRPSVDDFGVMLMLARNQV